MTECIVQVWIMKLRQIALGWFRLLKSKLGYISPELKELAASRLSICATCEHRSKVTCTCNICGCYLPAKAQVYTENCPDNRWMPVHYHNPDDLLGGTVIVCGEVPPLLKYKLYKYLGTNPENISLEKWEKFLNEF